MKFRFWTRVACMVTVLGFVAMTGCEKKEEAPATAPDTTTQTPAAEEETAAPVEPAPAPAEPAPAEPAPAPPAAE